MVVDLKINYTLPQILSNLSENELQDQVNERKAKLKKVYWDDIQLGDKVEMKVKVTRRLVNLFAMISADYNPLHVDEEFGKNLKIFGHKNIVHGYLLQSFFSGLGGSYLFGEGIALHEKKAVKFKHFVSIDDEILVQKIVINKFSKEIKGKERYFVETTEKIKILKDGKVIDALESGTITMVFKKNKT